MYIYLQLNPPELCFKKIKYLKSASTSSAILIRKLLTLAAYYAIVHKRKQIVKMALWNLTGYTVKMWHLVQTEIFVEIDNDWSSLFDPVVLNSQRTTNKFDVALDLFTYLSCLKHDVLWIPLQNFLPHLNCLLIYAGKWQIICS